ncbi:MAG: hypothetical protein ABF586_01555 [Sporolactobacillus sp.]
MILALNICLLWAMLGWYLCIRKPLYSQHALFMFLTSSIIIMLIMNVIGYPLYFEHAPLSAPAFLAMIVNRNGILPLLSVFYLQVIQGKALRIRILCDLLFLTLLLLYITVEPYYVLMTAIGWPFYLTGSILYFLFIRCLSSCYAYIDSNHSKS